MTSHEFIIQPDDPILITGATGFIGPAVIKSLMKLGFRNLRAFTKPSSDLARLLEIAKCFPRANVEIVRGNLLSDDDCMRAADRVTAIFHLANVSDKSFPNAFMNSVVTTRNLLEASLRCGSFKRFVNVSSFAVYPNMNGAKMVDESSVVDDKSELSGDAYCFAKVKQDSIVIEYGKRFAVPYVIVRPGSVYGPGKYAITGRVGIDTFGIFLHMGGYNRIPFTYVDNCADAIVLAGVVPGVEGEVFNVVDDGLPTSRQFLRLYKQNVRHFRSIYVPHAISYALCILWEKYSSWSEGQLPPIFNRRRWNAEWKRTRYSNQKLKDKLGWTPKVSMADGLVRFFEYCRERGNA